MVDFALIGQAAAALAGLYVLAGVAQFVYVYFLRPGKDLKKYGSWAVVTGSTDGIGKAYAFELARKGLNIVLVSRTLSKLQEVAKEIESKYKVQTKTVALDLSGDDSVFTSLGQAIEGLDVGVLVNNAGVGYEHPDYFLEIEPSKIDMIFRLNMRALTYVTRAVLPGMLQRKRGAIVNISSSSGYFPMGLLTVYSAAKAYVDYFSRGLAQEYQGRGIDVQAVLPFLVATKLSKIRSASLLVPSPSSFARQAVGLIGYELQTPGFWSHQLQLAVLRLLPQKVAEQYVYGMHAGIRKKALAKKERDAKAQ